MQSRDVLSPAYRPREFVFAARDRCDETVERIRSVRTDRFLYIRNFHPQRPHLQPNAYKDGKSIVQALRALHAAKTLDPLAERLLFSPTRPPEELYEWTTDRWQVRNLAGDPAHRAELEETRFKTTLDRGLRLLNDELDRLPDGADLPGQVAFKLYDTYGFPLDLTQDALRGEGREEVARLGWDRPAGLVNDVYREVVGAPA